MASITTSGSNVIINTPAGGSLEVNGQPVGGGGSVAAFATTGLSMISIPGVTFPELAGTLWAMHPITEVYTPTPPVITSPVYVGTDSVDVIVDPDQGFQVVTPGFYEVTLVTEWDANSGSEVMISLHVWVPGISPPLEGVAVLPSAYAISPLSTKFTPNVDLGPPSVTPLTLIARPTYMFPPAPLPAGSIITPIVKCHFGTQVSIKMWAAKVEPAA